ncbi:class I SAM-dependent methyltransferase [Allomesorhizobium camelthorni]|uniref:Class I SAM-dependent methyltransferase n=1 Tax=Allomesorhizobium camelthorni TaxID=475069 RepID=A0A6G4W7U2_9HYPH|nr:class I SAM-dependent methyltransferase [Mesorhizobium camelthorni]NGO50831.1 class I SAM-dependent methyltransferase [Mesorhizobium camelthorni]
MTAHANYSLRDEIRDYWSDRAETFDLQIGHEIFSEQERVAWHALLSRHLGPGAGRASLDLACGTGVISHLMHDLGFEVTGLDWSEAMLAKARAKAQKRGAAIRFIVRDAERTLEDKASYDVIVTRHLVWTLVDPKAAFAEWFSLLKPGGKLLVIDGDFVSRNWVRRLREVWEKLVAGRSGQVDDAGAYMMGRHRSILARVYFSGGARAEEIGRLLAETGFEQPVVDWKLGAIHRAQARQMSWPKALERATQHRFAICAKKQG